MGKILPSGILVNFPFESFMFALILYFYRTFSIHYFLTQFSLA